MSNQTKLLLALQQIENLTKLFDDNEYQQFFYEKLISIKCEVERQLSHYE